MTQTIANNSGMKLAHLVVQLQQKLCLTQEQAAMVLGIRRSSFARYVSTKGALPQQWMFSACRWIAGSLGLTSQQVEQFVAANPMLGAPMALLELDATQYFQIDEHAPRQVGMSLTRRWQSAAVTMICPDIPPMFLLTKHLINVLNRDQNLTANSVAAEYEWSQRMHRRIARQIWLSPELLPTRWEIIIPERTIDLMRSIGGSFSGASNEAMTELDEIWHHDLVGERKLVIRVLPECDRAVPILRHFSDARTLVLVDGVYRWKELCDQKRVHVTSIDSVSCNDALKWDRQIIDLARSLCIDHRPRGHSISLLGNLRDHRQEALQLRTHQLRMPA